MARITKRLTFLTNSEDNWGYQKSELLGSGQLMHSSAVKYRIKIQLEWSAFQDDSIRLGPCSDSLGLTRFCSVLSICFLPQ